MKAASYFFLVLCLFTCQPTAGQAQIRLDSTQLTVDTVISGIDIPWEITWGPDNHIWMTERYGRISRVNPTTGQQQLLVTLTDVTAQSESGLLGLVLHPNFVDTPWVFVAYTYSLGNAIYERIIRLNYQNNLLVRADTILEAIPENSTHNGARLLITPDRKLFITTGDAQNTSTPQNLTSANGKVLRFNLDGSIPDDNPNPQSPVWSFGHRNAQGLLLHPNGLIYSSEHGPSSDDELNIIYRNRNYGWPNVVGPCDAQNELFFCATNNVAEPIAWWTPTTAVSDLIWYDHPSIPEFRNRILLTTLKDKELYVMQLNAAGDSVLSQRIFLTNRFGRLRDICTDASGAIYLATNGQNWFNDSPFTHSIIRLRNANWNPNTSVAPNERGMGIKLLGNPLSPESRLVLPENALGSSYRLRDLSGRTVLEGMAETVEMHPHNWPIAAGTYLLDFQKGTLQQSLKLIR